jgi:hypothetical protein
MLYDPLNSEGTGQQIKDPPVSRRLELYCKHDIVAEWCASCKYDNPASIKVVLQQENLAIARNLDTWVKKKPTTSR